MGCSLGLTVFADTYKGSVWAFHLAEGINNKLIKINTNEGKLTLLACSYVSKTYETLPSKVRTYSTYLRSC